MRNFHDGLPSVIQRQVQPVQATFPDDFANAPNGWATNTAGGSWIPATPGSAFNPTSLWIDGINLGRLDLDHPSVPPAMRDDITVYTPGGERKAFALSAADLMSVSGPGTAFPTMASRLAPWPLTNWELRTRSQANNAWMILLPTPAGGLEGALTSSQFFNLNSPSFSPRPALILHDQDGAWTSGL